MADNTKVKALEKVKVWADAAFGALILLALPAAVIWSIWSADWRPGVTALIVVITCGAYDLCVERALKDARGG